MSGEEIVNKFIASEKYTTTHAVLLKNTDFEIWCRIEEVPGPYTFEWDRMLWSAAEKHILSGPRKEPCEGFFKGFLEETRGGKEYNPVISIVLLGSKLLDLHQRSPMLNPIKTEALELASKIEASFLEI